MINWRYYPRNQRLPANFIPIINVFEENEAEISSENNKLSSNAVLKLLRPHFVEIGFIVEASKAKKDRIRVPVLFGERGNEDLAFEADGYWENEKMVLEIEAGRAVDNYQFLKDFFQACMMYNIEYLCIAVRNTYRTNNRDYQKVCKFFDAMYSSRRIQTELKGILIIGY